MNNKEEKLIHITNTQTHTKIKKSFYVNVYTNCHLFKLQLTQKNTSNNYKFQNNTMVVKTFLYSK